MVLARKIFITKLDIIFREKFQMFAEKGDRFTLYIYIDTTHIHTVIVLRI